MGSTVAHTPYRSLRRDAHAETMDRRSVNAPDLFDFSGKLDAYAERLLQRDADRIRPSHIQRMLEKLEARRGDLSRKVTSDCSAEDAARNARKLAVLDGQIRNAHRLLDWVNDRSAK